MTKKVKALALFSGGLDSTLAVMLMLNQNIKVEAITFATPFNFAGKEADKAAEMAEKLKIPLTTVTVGSNYLRIVRKPKYGYGKNLNPCIDCRIFMLRKTKKCAEEKSAAFIFTGEVLDERPMTQNLTALMRIDAAAGLKGKVLRPLSAKLMPETEAEKKGWVDRNRLLDIRGRTRKRQIALAEEFGITNYAWPAGGCLLTYKEFSSKLRDLFAYKKRISIRDLHLLKVGRHFRLGKNKIVVGRNEKENAFLIELRGPNDYFFEVQGWGSPTTLLQGPKTKEAIEKAAQLTAYYSDCKTGKVAVKYGRKTLEEEIAVSIPEKEIVEKLRISRS